MYDPVNDLSYAERAASARRAESCGFDGLAQDAVSNPATDRQADRNEAPRIGRSFDSISTNRRTFDGALHDAISLMVTDALPQMVWSTLPDGYHDYYNAQWYEYTGVEAGSTDGDGWNGIFHADDRERCWARWQHCLATGEPYEVEYRLRRHDGGHRWMLGRALPMKDSDGAITRWVGTCTDIHEARLAIDRNELLAKEMDHRIANLFAIVGSLMALEARHAPSAEALAVSMQARLASLNAAHRLVRNPVPSSDEVGASVHSVIRAIVKPYQDDRGTRFDVSGVDRTVDDGALTAIALLTHELCTNAIKYGALTRDSGTVSITTDIVGPLFKLNWVERGGPTLAEEPISGGFGTVLIRATVEQQLGGTIQRLWTPEGLIVEMTLPLTRLHRDPHALAFAN